MPTEETPASATPTPTPQGAGDLADIRKLRAEAKKWRLRARDAEAKLAEQSPTPPQAQGASPAAPADDVEDLRGMVERLQADLAARDAALLRQRIASEAGLPAALAVRLQGDDEAALKADAEALKALIAPAAGGAPANPPAPASPAASQSGVTSVPNGLPATGRSEEQLRQEYLAGGERSSVPSTQQERSPDGRIVFRSTTR